MNKIIDLLNKTYHEYLLGKYGKPGMTYLKRRNINVRTINHFMIGFCNYNIGYKSLIGHFGDKQILDSGLFHKLDSGQIIDLFNQRVIFPTIRDGEILHMTSRAITDSPIPHLHQNGPIDGVFNYDEIDKNDYLIIVESPIDAMTLYQNDIPSIATMGIGGSIKKIIHKLNNKEIYIAYDADPIKKIIKDGNPQKSGGAGQRGALKLGEVLHSHGISSRIIRYPKSEFKIDVNIFFMKYDISDFKRLLNEAIPFEQTIYFKHRREHKRQINKYDNIYVDIYDIAKDEMELVPFAQGYRAICPFHADSSPSFTIYSSTNSFYCFGAGCNQAGDAIKLFQLLESNKGNILNRQQAIQELRLRGKLA